MTATQIDPIENDVLLRTITPHKGELPLSFAKSIAKLKISKHDRQRLHELALKNQSDSLTENERTELDAYLRIGRILDLMKVRARKTILLAKSRVTS